MRMLLARCGAAGGAAAGASAAGFTALILTLIQGVHELPQQQL
jgi:hypothetical protein